VPAGFGVLAAGAAAGGVSPANTAFLIGLMVRRYAKIALRSSSVMFLYTSDGIGGMIGVPLGFFPVRIVLMNVASV
jgi:hypothetical protein